MFDVYLVYQILLKCLEEKYGVNSILNFADLPQQAALFR